MIMYEKKIVNILGVEYTVLIGCDAEALPEDADGCMDHSTKKIKIAKIETDRDSVQNTKEYTKKILRHEIIHAFLYESGLYASSGFSECWATDETIVDWIAIQSPKIFKALKEVDAL